jgi:hypothetical protein
MDDQTGLRAVIGREECGLRGRFRKIVEFMASL